MKSLSNGIMGLGTARLFLGIFKKLGITINNVIIISEHHHW